MPFDEGRDSYTTEVLVLTAPVPGFSRVTSSEVCMKKSRSETVPASREAPRKTASTQPAATGANRGSPAAPVMKQFAKTKAESSGRS